MNETELVNAPKPKRRGPLGLLLKWGGFVNSLTRFLRCRSPWPR